MQVFNDNSFGTIETSNDPIKIASQDYTAFFVSGGEKARLTSDGRLGIGVAAPARKLEISSGHVRLSDDYKLEWGGGINYIQGSNANNRLIFATNNSEALRIESDGNLRVYDSIDNLAGTLTLNGRNTGQIRFESGGSLKMLMDSSGHLGIGVSSVSAPLHVSKSINNYVARFENSDASNPYTVWIREPSSASAGYPLLNISNNAGTDTYLRVDSNNGNLYLHTTSNVVSTTSGTGLSYASGYLAVSRDTSSASDAVQYLNRTGGDGQHLQFRKDGSNVGFIGNTGGDMFIGTGICGITFNDANNAILPWRNTAVDDGNIDIGLGSYRFKNIYATNGTIQTSDRNEKQDIEELSEAEQRVAVACKGLLRKFRWKSSVAEKGDDARIHFGIIAQDLQAAFEAEGLDAGRYGMFINSTWTDEETGEERSRMGVRYSELLAFIISAI